MDKRYKRPVDWIGLIAEASAMIDYTRITLLTYWFQYYLSSTYELPYSLRIFRVNSLDDIIRIAPPPPPKRADVHVSQETLNLVIITVAGSVIGFIFVATLIRSHARHLWLEHERAAVEREAEDEEPLVWRRPLHPELKDRYEVSLAGLELPPVPDADLKKDELAPLSPGSFSPFHIPLGPDEDEQQTGMSIEMDKMLDLDIENA